MKQGILILLSHIPRGSNNFMVTASDNAVATKLVKAKLESLSSDDLVSGTFMGWRRAGAPPSFDRHFCAVA